jgi:hypothetical protein
VLINTIRNLLRLLGPFHRVFPLVTLIGLAASFAEGLGIGLLIPFLEVLGGGRGEGNKLDLPHVASQLLTELNDTQKLLLIGSAILLLLTVKVGLDVSAVSISGYRAF